MQTFTTPDGLLWNLEINISTIKRLNAELQATGHEEVDLLESSDLIVKFADLVLVGDLIFLCVREQATNRNIDAETFLRFLRGDTLYKAREALIAEYIDFFPDPAIRSSLASLVVASEKFRAESLNLILARVQQIADQAIDQPGN